MLVKIDAIFFFFIERAAFSIVDKEMEKRTNNIIKLVLKLTA